MQMCKQKLNIVV